MHRPGKVYTSAEVQQLDRTAIDTFGIPGISLMRRAGRAAFDTLQRRWPDCRSITVACGSGNNAGDGYIVAGMAVEAGIETQLLQVGDPTRLKGDAATARDWATHVGVARGDTALELIGSVVVDALLGTGATGEIRPPYRARHRSDQRRGATGSLNRPSERHLRRLGRDSRRGSARRCHRHLHR